MTEKVFSKGIYVKQPRAKAPDFIFGSISIKYDEFVSWGGEYVNESGYINIDIKRSKDASKGLYCELNTYEKKEEDVPQQSTPMSKIILESDCPF